MYTVTVIRYPAIRSNDVSFNIGTLNFLRTGHYNRSYGYIDSRKAIGVFAANAARILYTYHMSSPYVSVKTGFPRGNGIAIRCVTREG